VWKLRGDALRFSGGEPFDSYDRAIEVRRAYYEASLAKAEAWMQRDDWRRARSELARTLDICPEYVDGLVLLARTHRAEAAEDGAAWERALEALDRAVAIDPDHYLAVTDRVELLVERLGEGRGPDRIEGLLEELERARQLDGCQNRVNLLEARARLAEGRRVAGSGGDPREHLRAAVRLADRAERTHPDARWREVRREALELQGTP
jgi:tetratricopeptide (TPR) repeat protein